MPETLPCKTCNSPLSDTDNYCAHCGAVVISERLTLKKIWHNFADDVLGWDNKYFATVKALTIHPDLVLGEYLSGVRKKYVSPFAFLAVAAALVTLIFNQFADEYLSISDSFYNQEMKYIERLNEQEKTEEYKQNLLRQREESNHAQLAMLKNLNLYIFLLIPFYALLSFWVFGKPFNFGEHLVIASYLQGLLFFSSLLLFIFGILIHPLIYYCNVLISVCYYMYSYGRLYKLKPLQYVLKFLKFVGIVILIILAATLIAYIIGLLFDIK